MNAGQKTSDGKSALKKRVRERKHGCVEDRWELTA